MYYKAELNYLLKVLRKMHLQALLLSPGEEREQQADFGLRKFLGLERTFEEAFQRESLRAGEKVIYKVKDEFACNYVFLMLPEAPEAQALLVGPYITFELSKEDLMEAAERYSVPAWRFHQLEEYYTNVPLVQNELPLLSLMTAFGEVLWGSGEAFEVVDLNRELASPQSIIPERGEERSPEDITLHMKLMETRYDYENELMEMVSQGQSNRAEAMMAAFSNYTFEPRMTDALRNQKNYIIICNTLLRKAAERGGVHPVHLDSVSSDFARKIEALPNTAKGNELMANMVRTYCRLVRKYTMKHYSPLVQKAVAYIEADLSGDLSLSALAAVQNINASYLSALFRKETGKTVTEYVNEKRMEAGARLLSTTRLQVQTIAQYCGLSDVNYFSKIFKKHYGMTPKQYREEHHSHLRSK